MPTKFSGTIMLIMEVILLFDFKVGDLVLLTFDTGGYVGITPRMLKYKDRKFRVARVKHIKGQTKTNHGTYYELKGCVTEYGIPYAIMPSWIRPMRELKR